MELTERFWSKVQKTDTCWLWTASKTKNGYGRLRGALAHKWLWEKVNGPVPEGLELDHLCRVRHCVRPDHLEAVTHAENILRGEAPSALNARKTHCVNGHPFDEQNTYINVRLKKRLCKACRAACEARRRCKVGGS